MRVYITLFILQLFMAMNVLAADEDTKEIQEGWTRDGSFNLNFSQTSLSNWIGGGENDVSFVSHALYRAIYKQDKHLWQTRLELLYGLSKAGSESWDKTDDKIFLISDYGYNFRKAWYLSTLLTFQTQFTNGFQEVNGQDVKISRFMAPGYLTWGLGIKYQPEDWYSLYLSPVSWRGVFVTNDELSNAGAFGVTPGKKLKSELGAQFVGQVKYEFLPNMTVDSQLLLFSNYLDKPQNIDVNWQVAITMQVNKWISASVLTNLKYDDDAKILQPDGTEKTAVQFLETVGVGLGFTF